MTKEQWIEISKDKDPYGPTELPISVFHEYYIEKGGIVQDLQVFTQVFFTLVNNFPVLIQKTNRVVAFDYVQMVHALFHYYNTKFKIGEYESVKS